MRVDSSKIAKDYIRIINRRLIKVPELFEQAFVVAVDEVDDANRNRNRDEEMSDDEQVV